MKKLLPILLLVTLLILAACESPGSKEVDENEWEVHTSNEHGYSISLPQGWTSKESNANCTSFTSPQLKNYNEIWAETHSEITEGDFFIGADLGICNKEGQPETPYGDIKNQETLLIDGIEATRMDVVPDISHYSILQIPLQDKYLEVVYYPGEEWISEEKFLEIFQTIEIKQKESAAPDPNVYYTIDEEANVVLKINRMDEPSNEDDIELARFPLPFNWENYDTDFDSPTKKGLLFWKLAPEQELTGERGPMTYAPVSNTNFYFFNNEEETFTELPDYTLKATDTEIEEPYDLYGSTSENKMVIVIAQITTEAIYSSYFDPGIGFGSYPNSYYGLLYDISFNTLEKIDLENYNRFSTKIWDSKNEKMVEFLHGEGCGSCGVVFSNLKTGVEKEIRPWDMNFGRVANLWTDEEANWVTIMGESTEGHTIIFLYDGYGNLLKEKTLIGVSLKNAEERSYSDDYHLEDYDLSQEYPILRLNNPEQTLVDFNDAEAPFISELSEETMDDRKEFIETYYRAIGEREYYKAYKLSKKDTSLETFQNWYNNTSQVILKSVTHLNDAQSLVELSLMEGGETINYKTEMTLKFEEGKPTQIEDTEVQVVK